MWYGECQTDVDDNVKYGNKLKVLHSSYLQEKSAQWWANIDGLVQERPNSCALKIELRFSCTNPSIWIYFCLQSWGKICFVQWLLPNSTKFKNFNQVPNAKHKNTDSSVRNKINKIKSDTNWIQPSKDLSDQTRIKSMSSHTELWVSHDSLDCCLRTTFIPKRLKAKCWWEYIENITRASVVPFVLCWTCTQWCLSRIIFSETSFK